MFDRNDFLNINRMNRIIEDAERMRTTSFFSRQNDGNGAYIRELKDHISDLQESHSSLLAHAKNLHSLCYENSLANVIASNGNTVAGYTNNSAQELLLLRNQLVCVYGGEERDASFIGLPFRAPNHNPSAPYLKKLNQAQINEINLRLLCRMEWYDWCLHVEVMAKAGALILDAMMNPNDNNVYLRNPEFVAAFQKENKIYTAARELAKDVKHGERVRDQFEAERYSFWKDKIGFKLVDGSYYPNSEATRQLNPNVRFDQHLPAGRLAKQYGINIETGKKSRPFPKHICRKRCGRS